MAGAIGSFLRQAGAAFERLGAGLQADLAIKETLSRHREVIGLQGKKPTLADIAFVAPCASVIGDVQIGNSSGIFYGAIVKGDLAKIRIGENSMIKDRAVLAANTAGSTISIGNNVIVGQGATIGAATLEDDAVIGMGATVADGAVVKKGAYVAPGAVLESKATVPAGQIFAGSPAKFLRNLTPVEVAALARATKSFGELATRHGVETSKDFLDIEQDKSDHKWRTERSSDYDSSLGTLEKNPRAQVSAHLAPFSLCVVARLVVGGRANKVVRTRIRTGEPRRLDL